MNIQIIAVGTLSKEFKPACEKYFKSISNFANINVLEIKEFSEEKNIETKIKKETNLILSKINKNSKTFLFSINGKEYDSFEFSNLIINDKNQNLTFIIGGSNGVDEVMLNNTIKISVSKMTFPHQLFRCLALEQIYRAIMINKNKKYHK